MPLNRVHEELLVSIHNEWNRAEQDIKIAEQVCNKIIFPSIKELRYAGRRIVDAITKMIAGESDREIESLLKDAEFDCHRARHDAIDAATAKIAIDLEIMAKKLGYDVILPIYPGFPKLMRNLSDLRKQISDSRRDRQNREKIYSVLETVNFPALVELFNELRGSEEIMVKLAKRRRRFDLLAIAGFAAGLIAVIFEAYRTFFE